jgi:hypothetical protein
MLRPTIVGSLPKPAWLADARYELFAPWVAPQEVLRELGSGE